MMMIADPVFWRVVSRRDGCVFFIPGNPRMAVRVNEGKAKKCDSNARRTRIPIPEI